MELAVEKSTKENDYVKTCLQDKDAQARNSKTLKNRRLSDKS